MSFGLIFELPAIWLCALPVGILLGFVSLRQRRHGLPTIKIAALLLLRSLLLLVILFLAARPVLPSGPEIAETRRPVVVLLDRSKSMSVQDADATRYHRASDFLRRRLQPALEGAKLPVRQMVFDETAEFLAGSGLAAVKPEGKWTNLGLSIETALHGSQTPLAVIVLTDGIANETADDLRVMSRLADTRVPFIGVGFGSDDAAPSISVRHVDAPLAVAPKTSFNVSAEVEMVRAQQTSICDMVLFRDDQLLQKRALQLRAGSRTWIENFSVTEVAPGTHRYTLRLMTTESATLNQVKNEGSASVRITDGDELRVLYVQGALTWDYKFISLATRSDPVIKLTGLTRTSEQSVFRQNVEAMGELLHGFPRSLDELGRYRVVVLANVRPNDFSLDQQELLAQFCGDRGGGILMLGGPATFDASWTNSRLEKLLPVTFSGGSDSGAADHDFRLQLSPAALHNPIFRLAETGSVQEKWSTVPPFQRFGRVDFAKPGAQVWISHPSEVGPDGPRILMASQPYGAGISTVLCLENFWRWRLAKDSDPQTFDRFWRQLFRWLGNAGRQQVSIDITAQDLRPEQDIQIVLQRQLDAQSMLGANRRFLFQIEDSDKHVIQSESVELANEPQADFRFHPNRAGSYTLNVRDSEKSLVATRVVEIGDVDVELQHTARSIETLNRWAAISDGLAFKAEECPQAVDLVAQIRKKVEQQVSRPHDTPRRVGLNAWTFTLLLGCLSAEWFLRKRWGLI